MRIERSIDALSNLERGKSLPSFGTIEKLSSVLNVPFKALFDFDNVEPSRKRAQMLEDLAAHARSLGDADLELALEQVKLLAKRSTKSA